MWCKLTKDNIENQFITNPVWEEVFLKNFPNWTPETYIDNAVSLFNKNGYTIINKRRSERPDSKFYNVVDCELQKDGEFIFSIQTHIDASIKEVLLDCICNYEIDFSTFK
jgi:hypothetical protein